MLGFLTRSQGADLCLGSVRYITRYSEVKMKNSLLKKRLSEIIDAMGSMALEAFSIGKQRIASRKKTLVHIDWPCALEVDCSFFSDLSEWLAFRPVVRESVSPLLLYKSLKSTLTACCEHLNNNRGQLFPDDSTIKSVTPLCNWTYLKKNHLWRCHQGVCQQIAVSVCRLSAGQNLYFCVQYSAEPSGGV